MLNVKLAKGRVRRFKAWPCVKRVEQESLGCRLHPERGEDHEVTFEIYGQGFK